MTCLRWWRQILFLTNTFEVIISCHQHHRSLSHSENHSDVGDNFKMLATKINIMVIFWDVGAIRQCYKSVSDIPKLSQTYLLPKSVTNIRQQH